MGAVLLMVAIIGCAQGSLAGGPTPTPTPTGSPTPTPTPTPSSTPTPTPGSHSVALTWSASSSSGVVGYNVYRGQTSSGPFAKVGNVATTSFTDTSVQAGQTYFYVLTAVNSSNVESATSTPVSTTVP